MTGAATRSRRITTPRFTAVSDTKANAIVIEIDGRVVLGLSGPRPGGPMR